MNMYDISTLHLLIICLAVFRLSSLFAYEDGPFSIFYWVRQKAGVKYDKAGNPYGTNTFADGLICLWCNSVWFGIAVVIAYSFVPIVVIYALLPLAFSAAAILFSEITR